MSLLIKHWKCTFLQACFSKQHAKLLQRMVSWLYYYGIVSLIYLTHIFVTGFSAYHHHNNNNNCTGISYFTLISSCLGMFRQSGFWNRWRSRSFYMHWSSWNHIYCLQTVRMVFTAKSIINCTCNKSSFCNILNSMHPTKRSWNATKPYYLGSDDRHGRIFMIYHMTTFCFSPLSITRLIWISKHSCNVCPEWWSLYELFSLVFYL